jgi:NAD(P)-dependent dehydrogenase (short-subunit alcohol dehydrogenase family)
VDYRALKLDLSSQKAVRDAAATLLSWNDVPEVNILVNNAAVMNLPERTLSEDGLEMQFATNHIGHFLFTCLIMPKLIKAAENSPKGATRVINVSSLSPTRAGMRWSDINFEKVNKTLPKEEQPTYAMHKMWGAVEPEEKSYLPLEGYNQSKVANVLFSIAANKRLYEKYGILSIALHPGIMQTELSRYAAPETLKAIKGFFTKGDLYIKTLGAGASTTIVAATDPGLGVPRERDGKENWGAFLIDCQISDKADPRAVSSKEAEKLWTLSEKLVKDKFEW